MSLICLTEIYIYVPYKPENVGGNNSIQLKAALEKYISGTEIN